MPCLPARQSWPDQCRSRVLACPAALQVNTHTHTFSITLFVYGKQKQQETATTTTSGQWTIAMWMDLTDTDLCTRQSHLWPRWATSRIDRCIVRPGIPPGSKLPRTARWRNRTRWWPPLQGKRSQEIVRRGYLYSCIFTLDWTRAFTGIGPLLLVSFLLSFTERHVYKLLLLPSKRDSCCVPLSARGKEVSCQSSLASVCWATDKYFHSAPGAARADDCSTAHTLHTLWYKWHICPIPAWVIYKTRAGV